jgi:Fe2+ or Zn2+ uptake regulation protein
MPVSGLSAARPRLTSRPGRDLEAERTHFPRFIDRFQRVGQTATVPTSSDLARMLREVGLRVTRPRTAVLSAVHEHPHADTDSILGFVRRDHGDVSHQAVYDVLRALTATGLLRRIQPTGSLARYEARVGDNHHHLVCRSCGAIVDVDCAVGEAPCLTAGDAAGYAIDEAEVIYWGRCPDCMPSPRTAAGSGEQAPTDATGTVQDVKPTIRQREPEIRRDQS